MPQPEKDKRILVHCCCGPCSLEPVRALEAEGFEPVLCWTNPNIQPVAEHERRLETFKEWAASGGYEVIVGSDDREKWENLVAPCAFDREARCRRCYAQRLAEAGRIAKDKGFAYITTTLAVSPYQLFDACTEILEGVAKANGLSAVVRDFRPRYPEAVRRSRELGMYRQNYCGCRFSAVEAAEERVERRDQMKRERAARRAQE